MGKVRLQIPFAERVCVSDRGLASISERNIIEAGALFLRSRNIFVSLTNAVLITLDRVIFCSLFFSPPLLSLSLSVSVESLSPQDDLSPVLVSVVGRVYIDLLRCELSSPFLSARAGYRTANG